MKGCGNSGPALKEMSAEDASVRAYTGCGQRAVTHPGSVGLAFVAKGKDQDYGQDGQNNSEEDANIVMGLEEERKTAGEGGKCVTF